MELIMVLLIIGVLGLAGSGIFLSLIEQGITTPQDLGTNFAAAETINRIIDGDGVAPGLRFSRLIVTADASEVGFVAQNGDAIEYRYDETGQWLYRSVNGSPEELWPPYEIAGMKMIDPGEAMFQYLDEDGNATAQVQDIRQVIIRIRVRMGKNSDVWSSNVQLRSAVTVYQY